MENEGSIEIWIQHVEQTDTILLGPVIGTAYVGKGETLEVQASGKSVRFTLTNHPGYVEIDLSEIAGTALAVLRAKGKA